jgi:hypothetical protein
MTPRPLRWAVALAHEESTLIHDAAHRAGMKPCAWGRAAMLRQAQLEGVAPELAALMAGQVRAPRRVVRGRKR